MSIDREFKVIFIDESMEIGGAEKYLKMVVQHFSKICHAYLIYPDDALHADFYDGIDIVPIPYSLKQYECPAIRLASYFTTFRSIKPDMLHVNLPSPVSCNLVIVAARLFTKGNILSTIHLPSIKFKRSLLGMLAGKGLWDWLSARAVFAALDMSIVVSKAGVTSLSENYPVKKEKIACIYNGVELSRFATVPHHQILEIRKALDISSHETVVTSIGRLHQQKGYCYLLTAMQMVARVAPNVKLLLIGDGALREELAAQAVETGLAHSVVFLGERNDIPEILACTDIYINSSLNEGLPFSVLEAMAAGVPVVATMVEGNRELVRNAETGLLVPPRDPENLAKAIILLLNDQKYRMALGLRGKERIIRHFSVDQMMLNTFELYEKCTCKH